MMVFSGIMNFVPKGTEFWPYWSDRHNPGELIGHYPSDFTRNVLPKKCHSHNDYWRSVPFYEAIHFGCTSIEADVFKMENDELYVSHSSWALNSQRTLKSLYLNPAMEALQRMNAPTEFENGTNVGSRRGIFDEDPSQTLILLVDFKNKPEEVFDLLMQQLEPLRLNGYLTYADETGKLVQGALTVVCSGVCPFHRVLENSARRDIFFDAPLEKFGPKDLDDSLSKYNITNSFYASASLDAVGINFAQTVTSGRLQIIKDQISGAHKAGLNSRYWEVWEWPAGARNLAWRTLVELGSDYLSIDNVKALAEEAWGKWTVSN
jgi:hypothetical protein